MSRLFKAVIKENIRLNPRTFLLTLQPVEPIQKPEPGQFFMVSIEHGLDPLLKRAFSLYRWFGQAPQQKSSREKRLEIY
ncbi:MAG: hypothetical protein HZC12_07115 [Nitrospirae bacterium]|nr:hypothetical protein [Nitrospirota bacterium]